MTFYFGDHSNSFGEKDSKQIYGCPMLPLLSERVVGSNESQYKLIFSIDDYRRKL